jgi:cystathionine gamma-synthase
VPERLLAALEQGQEALLFASGMASAVAVFETLPIGAHVVAQNVMYWGLREWLRSKHEAGRLSVTFAALEEVGAAAAAVRSGETKLVWAESPSNPLWRVVDIQAVAEVAHEAGAAFAVDSTAATPILTRPLTLGADIVMHSATKYLNGHSDVIAGTLAFKDKGPLWQLLKTYRHDTGAVLAPFESWLLLRGMRTLHIRVRVASSGALTLAQQLQSHPMIEQVRYPGLQDAPDHSLAKRQMGGGFGGMLSIQIKGGEQAAIGAAARVKIWKRATSLGGVESLIEHRSSIEGLRSPVPTNLLRLSVGIEDPADLYGDLDQALS